MNKFFLTEHPKERVRFFLINQGLKVPKMSKKMSAANKVDAAWNKSLFAFGYALEIFDDFNYRVSPGDPLTDSAVFFRLVLTRARENQKVKLEKTGRKIINPITINELFLKNMIKHGILLCRKNIWCPAASYYSIDNGEF